MNANVISKTKQNKNLFSCVIMDITLQCNRTEQCRNDNEYRIVGEYKIFGCNDRRANDFIVCYSVNTVIHCMHRKG